MGTFVKGDVVVLPFPFSDLTAAKKRPALVIAALSGDDIVIALITSQKPKATVMRFRFPTPIFQAEV